MNRNISIISLTDSGCILAKKIVRLLGRGYAFHKPQPFAHNVQTLFKAGDALVLICATGIAVRTLAPVLKSKLEDPPVLVLDECGKFVIPLLSGHEGGANEWANQIAKLLSAELVLTTAQKYIDPMYTVGMGCERNCSMIHLEKLFHDAINKSGLTTDQIHSINSIDIKADEVGLRQLSEKLNIKFQTFDKLTLSKVDDQLSVKSDYVFKTVGVYGVAESAALVAAKNVSFEKCERSESELLLPKIKTIKATCAIAKSYSRGSDTFE